MVSICWNASLISFARRSVDKKESSFRRSSPPANEFIGADVNNQWEIIWRWVLRAIGPACAFVSNRCFACLEQ